MCAGIHHPTRGGTRGGKDQFDWEDVKIDKDRECYLGHSVMAPVGRWQKGKDLTWYTKKSKAKDFNAVLEAERAAVKKAEEEAMAAALGLKPAVKPQQALSKQEAAEVFRRQSQDDQDEGEERIKGVGFSGRSQLRKRSRADSSSNDLRSMFEHDTANDVKGSMPTYQPERSQQQQPDTTSSSGSNRDKLRAKLRAYLEKKACHDKPKKKKKKERKSSKKESKKLSRRRRSSTSSSDSEEWVEADSRTVKVSRQSKHTRDKHRRRNSSESSDTEMERRRDRSHRDSYTRQHHRATGSEEDSRSREYRPKQHHKHEDSLPRKTLSDNSYSEREREHKTRKQRRHEHEYSPTERKRGRYDAQ